ncbi:hypothetical protein EV174_002494 [Coemansia sp. RSA 2320]|nr:hypothetical protein EV174_002494 [Coemansia sp. RSA 2320]
MQYVRANEDYYARMQPQNRSSGSSNPSPGPQPLRHSNPLPGEKLATGAAGPTNFSAPPPPPPPPQPWQLRTYMYPEVKPVGQPRPPPISNSMSAPVGYNKNTAHAYTSPPYSPQHPQQQQQSLWRPQPQKQQRPVAIARPWAPQHQGPVGYAQDHSLSAPTSHDVGLPLENRPGYRCLLYVVDGALEYDNGLSGEKLLSKGTLHLSTTGQDTVTYVKNPSKSHRAHIIRLWIEMDDTVNNGGMRRFPDYHYKIRHIADSDKQNCLLTIAQPSNYRPSFGMTAQIYGPFMPINESEAAKKASAQQRDGAVSPLESAYYMSQSALITRPAYFTPEPFDLLDSMEMGKEWEVMDAELTSRVCVDPLLVDEDLFVSVCTLEPDARIVYEPYDLHDQDRREVQRRRQSNPARANRRRLWIQTLVADYNIEGSANGGRLVINGDGSSRMRPGDSAYVRRIELTEKVVLENCGRAPIEFIMVETPY